MSKPGHFSTDPSVPSRRRAAQGGATPEIDRSDTATSTTFAAITIAPRRFAAPPSATIIPSIPSTSAAAPQPDLSAPHRRPEPVALSAGRARRPIAHAAGPKRAGPSGLYAAVDRAGVALASTPYLTTPWVRPVSRHGASQRRHQQPSSPAYHRRRPQPRSLTSVRRTGGPSRWRCLQVERAGRSLTPPGPSERGHQGSTPPSIEPGWLWLRPRTSPRRGSGPSRSDNREIEIRRRRIHHRPRARVRPTN